MASRLTTKTREPGSRHGADVQVIIPMQGMAESLNVSVAAALVLFEAQAWQVR